MSEGAAANVNSSIFKNTVINNDLKKYQDHPLVIKKAEKAIELLNKAKKLRS